MPTPKPSENRPDLKGLADQVAFALVRPVEELAALELEDGSIARPDHDRANALLEEIAPLGGLLASACAQDAYATALRQDISSWRSGGLDTPPDFARSRDAIHAPEDGMPFFFLGPLRLANGARAGWRFETFLSLREEPSDPAYLALYRRYPHPSNICQSSHLLAGSNGLTNGNNIVFFPENIKASSPVDRQKYAIFFFNKFRRIFNEITIPAVREATQDLDIANPTGDDARACYKARCVWGYLHDYFHHQGPRPFNTQVAIKTRWTTGLLEEIKVDLQSLLACLRDDVVDGRAVAEFILLDRAFRYPLEPDWNRNFDSGTGLILLARLLETGAIALTDTGRIRIDGDRLPKAADRFIAEIEALERLDDEAYPAGAKALVRRYLPEAAPPGARFDRPAPLAESAMTTLPPPAALSFTLAELQASCTDLLQS
ncbi:MAG: hypothetical protein CMN86_08015 [Stappia sp.]|nr:hypothetical protein [Stappia sp.]